MVPRSINGVFSHIESPATVEDFPQGIHVINWIFPGQEHLMNAALVQMQPRVVLPPFIVLPHLESGVFTLTEYILKGSGVYIIQSGTEARSYHVTAGDRIQYTSGIIGSIVAGRDGLAFVNYTTPPFTPGVTEEEIAPYDERVARRFRVLLGNAKRTLVPKSSGNRNIVIP